jgi:hypothetical protein
MILGLQSMRPRIHGLQSRVQKDPEIEPFETPGNIEHHKWAGRRSERLEVGDSSTYRSEIINEDTPLMDRQSNCTQRFWRALEHFYRESAGVCFCSVFAAVEHWGIFGVLEVAPQVRDH